MLPWLFDVVSNVMAFVATNCDTIFSLGKLLLDVVACLRLQMVEWSFQMLVLIPP